MRETFDAVIIGGGAAGLMCALTAGQRGRRVLLIEHARSVGRKILMSGGGRCNFTNTGTTPAQFLSANPYFCISALARCTPDDFIAMVDRHGIAWHEKELGQLFCDVSSKAIVRMLLAECAGTGVRIETSCSVKSLRSEGAAFMVETSSGAFETAALVIASGGLSIPRMGATGFGYGIARQFGVPLLPTRAGLVPLTLSGAHAARIEDLAGVALPIAASCNGARFDNAMLITHRGLSGPAILQISSYWQPGEKLRIDLIPDFDAFAWLREERGSRPTTALRTVLTERLPRRLAQRLCETGMPDTSLAELGDKALAEVAAQLHDWPLQASGTEGYRTAEVTLGGVDTRALSSGTMESKSVPGLYFIGEVVDVTGWLGGYNFQWAWASGAAAGNAL